MRLPSSLHFVQASRVHEALPTTPS